MSHSCYANLEPVSSPHNTITMRAKKHIKQGEELTIFYTDFLESRHSIRSKILNEWKFLCQCQRCTDNTEFGSNFSSFKCNCGGYFYEEREKMWKCSQCKEENNLTNDYKVADDLWDVIPTQKIDFDALNTIMTKKKYHKQFYVSIKLYQVFIEQHQSATDRDTIENVIDKTDIVLTTMSQLEGGCSRLAAKYLTIRSNCQGKLLKLKHANKEISEKELKTAIGQIMKCKVLVAKIKG